MQRETVPSFLSRIAAMNGVACTDIALDMGFSLKRVVHLDESALRLRDTETLPGTPCVREVVRCLQEAQAEGAQQRWYDTPTLGPIEALVPF
jgi:hypothetical protein